MAARAADSGAKLGLYLAGSWPGPEAESAASSHGITSLAVHVASNRLLASCHNSQHHLFDALRPDQGPIATYNGHCGNSFYITSAFSPCGTHIASGSTDKRFYLWQVDTTLPASPLSSP